MGTYRVEWPCCESVTITEAWEPDRCPFCYTPPLEAAAPELFEALADAEIALAHLQNSLGVRVNPPTLEKARAALAKARGE